MATPVAKTDADYTVLGRVFPDPLATCKTGAPPCSPSAQGNTPATQFIGVDEFFDAIQYMNTSAAHPDWKRYMEIYALDGKLGEGAGNGKSDVPGNNLATTEFDPEASFVSAGLPTTDLNRQKSDLVAVRVTDETVPDKGKKRYALSLSIHGIERAGVEGATRAMEDLVTAATLGKTNTPVVSGAVKAGAPTFGDVLKKSIIYFTYPNPDGWRRGSVSSGGVFFQRYNGNGVDPNRDWPDVGYAFRGYSAVSEPETKAWIEFYNDVKAKTKSGFAGGDDLHGQPFADALSYTLLPHGSHKYDKNNRIQESAKRINRGTYDAIKWSPIVQDNDAPKGGGPPCAPGALGDTCAKIYAQTWGSVYDTINYTTTGALGDWFDSRIGLNSDGIDNEMSFSHLDKNITFDPHTEQLHVDGNKALIYARLTELLQPTADRTFSVRGRKGYVPNRRLKQAAKTNLPTAPPGSQPQSAIIDGPKPAIGEAAFEFTVLRGPQDSGSEAGKNIYNGGMRVEITDTNALGVGTGQVTLKVQCSNCDDHPGVDDEPDEWATVAEDYNQSFVYAQAGIVATVNSPQAVGRNGKPVKWRALVEGPTATAKMNVVFTKGPASADGDTGGGRPPVQRAYNVANTDFLTDLNPFIRGRKADFGALSPKKVIAGKQNLRRFDTIVLADDPLPGYTGTYGGAAARPTGPPTKNIEFSGSSSAPGADSHAPGSTEEKEFTIGPNDANKSFTVKIQWEQGTNDFDLNLYKVDDAGKRSSAGSSGGAPPGTSEQVTVPDPKPGKYVVEVVNYAAADPRFSGTVKFEPLPASATAGKSAYTVRQKNKWMAALKKFAATGGNLVLTDGALRALPELTAVPASAIARQTVYAGQSAFAKAANQPTTKDPLAQGVEQQGARFNSGMRRQMFEPTPLGFAIQNEKGADAANSRQFDIDRAAWEKAGGRTVAASADSGARNAAAVYSRVTIGELRTGPGAIRVAGALLPQPTNEYDHQEGLEAHAVTYTGYVMARNLFEPLREGLARFVVSKRASRSRLGSRFTRVKVACKEERGCKGTMVINDRVRVGRGKKARTRVAKLGTASYSFKGLGTKVLNVRLTAAGRRFVARRVSRKVYTTSKVAYGDGTSQTVNTRHRIYRPAGKDARRR